MRYMTFIRISEDQSSAPSPELFPAIAALGQEAGDLLVDQGGLLPTAAGGQLRLTDGTVTAAGGPFDSGELVVGGWATWEVDRFEQVQDWTRTFLELHAKHWPGADIVCDIRQVMDMAGPPA